MDIASISTVIASLKTATDIAKFIKESDLTLEKAESKLKLSDLISALADAKIEISEIQQLLQSKDMEISKLRNELEVQQKIRWQEPYYWISDSNGLDQGPYCQHCYDTSRKLIRLQGNGEGWWECKACKSTYSEKSRRQNLISSIPRDYDPY